MLDRDTSANQTESESTPAAIPAAPLVYIVGTYPTITTTFIDREIEALRDLGVSVDLISIRTAAPEVSGSPAYADVAERVRNLLPTSVARLATAHGYLLTRLPGKYLGTLWYLLTRPHPGWRARVKTLLHFGEAGLAAFHLRDRRHGHIHAHFLDRASTLALAVGRMLSIPYSLTAHANDIFVGPVMLREKIGQAAFVVTVSEFNKAHLLSMAPDVPADHISVIHPWVDVAAFTAPPAQEEGGPFRIVSVGRLVEKKGHSYLVDACRILADRGLDFRCTIVGDGPLREDLENRIRTAQLTERIHLLGAQPQSEVRRLVAESDVFALACVVASDGDRDGIPVALAEAMALEVPVVSTELVGIGELVQPGSGLLAPPGDSEALADAIEDIAQADSEERRVMGTNARAVVATHFDLRREVRTLASLYAGAGR